MEIFTEATITLKSKETITTPEILDVGSNYYFLDGKEVKIVKKTSVKTLDYKEKILKFDNSRYLDKKQTVIC